MGNRFFSLFVFNHDSSLEELFLFRDCMDHVKGSHRYDLDDPDDIDGLGLELWTLRLSRSRFR